MYSTVLKNQLKLNLLNILIIFSCCSENINGPNRQDGSLGCPNVSQQTLYTIEEFGITANGKSFVSDVLNYADTSNTDNIFIDFMGMTNTDTSNYRPLLRIQADGDSVLTETTELEINRYHTVSFDFRNHDNLSFYLALQCEQQVCDSARLYLYNLRIYRYY